MPREAKWRSKRPPMVGAFPEDHEDELSESDASETSSEYLSSPTARSNGQGDRDMDALGDALQSSLTASTHAPRKGYAIDDAAKQALNAIEEQWQYELLGGSSEPVPNRTPAPSPEGYSAPSPNDSFTEGSTSPDTTPQTGSPLFGNLDLPPTGPTFSSFLSDPPVTANIFGNLPSYDANKSPASLFSNRASGSGARPSLENRRLFGAVDPSPTVDPAEERPSPFKRPVQAFVDQAKSMLAARPRPKSLFDKTFTDDVDFFNPLGTTPSKPVQSASPFLATSSLRQGTLFNSTRGTPAQPVQYASPFHSTSSFGNKKSTVGFNFSNTTGRTPAQPTHVPTPAFPPESSSNNGATLFGHPDYAAESFRNFHALSSRSSDASLSDTSSTEDVGDDTKGATPKRQSEHLNTAEPSVTDHPVPTEHPFGQQEFDCSPFNSATSFKFGLSVHPETSDSPDGERRFNSSADFITAALHNISFDGDDKASITESLTSLYESVMCVPDRLASATKNLDQGHKAISDIDSRILSLEHARKVVYGNDPKGDTALYVLLMPLQKQKEQLQSLLRSNTILRNEHRDLYLTQILHTLEFFAKYSGESSDANDGAREGAKGDRMVELLDELARLKDGIKGEIELIDTNWEKKMESMQQKATAKYRNELNEKLAKCALDKNTALRQIKDQYAARISDAETKSRLHKKATAQIEELEATIRRLGRERSELVSAKATVEKALEESETQASTLQGYKEAYNQIVEERDQLQGEYYDLVAEHEELRQTQGALGEAPDQQDVPASVQAKSALQTGTLQSYDTDLKLLENYWSRQENFAEMTMRETAAEIRDVQAQIDEAVRQLRLLDAPDDDSNADSDVTGPEDEAEGDPQPSVGESSRSQLLDTLTHPLNTSSNQVQASQPTPRAPKAGRSRPTWAKKAAKAKDSGKRTGQGYVHTSYHGHGVSTVKRVDSDDKRR